MRFTFLALLAGTMVTASLAGTISQPHIIFMLVDDLGFNDVPWHNPSLSMPNIGNLAKEGVILEQSYTLAVCTPSRSALLSGRYPFTIGRQSSALKPLAPTGLSLNVTLLPEALKKAGYHTHMVGKWHLGFCKWEYTPTYRGFDSFFGYYVGATSHFTNTRGDTAKLSKRKEHHAMGYDLRMNKEPFIVKEGHYSTFLYSDRAQEVILSHDPSNPLFLYLPFQAVHGPLEAPQKYIDLYSHVQDKDRRVYFGMLAALDEAVGDIVKALKTSGLYNNSVLVFTSDNGGGYQMGGNNWPLKGHKSTLWEGGTRVPTFIRSPLLEHPGTVHERLFHVVDWFPTLAGLGGAPVPEDLDGVDQFTSLSTGSTPPREKFVYNIADQHGSLKAAVRVGDFKLVVGERRGDFWVPPPERPNKDVGGANKDVGGANKDVGGANKGTNSSHLDSMEYENEKDSSPDEFPIPSFRDEILNDTLRSDDDGDETSVDGPSLAETLDAVDCSEFTRKECRKLKRQLETFRRFTRVEDFFERKTKISLYDLASDPNEEQDLSASKPAQVRALLQELLKDLPRAVVADNPPRIPAGDPKNFGGVWSPGWC